MYIVFECRYFIAENQQCKSFSLHRSNVNRFTGTQLASGKGSSPESREAATNDGLGGSDSNQDLFVS